MRGRIGVVAVVGLVAFVVWLTAAARRDAEAPADPPRPRPAPAAPRDPEPPRPPEPEPVRPAPRYGDDLLKREDPEVAAFIQKRGWRLFEFDRDPDQRPTVKLEFQKHVSESEPVPLTVAECRLLARSKVVEWLDLTHVTPHLTDEMAAALATGSRVTTLRIRWNELTDAGAKNLANARGLEVIDLWGKSLTDDGIAALAALPKLKRLGTNAVPFTGRGLRPLAASDTLESFEMENNREFDDDGAKALGALSRLNYVHIWDSGGPSKMTPAGLKVIVRKRVPAFFSFPHELIDDEALKLLVTGGWFYRPKAEQGRYDSGPTTPAEVKYLSFGGSTVTDEGFKLVANCTNVTSLSLAPTLSDETVLLVSKSFKKVEFVGLSETRVSAKAVAALGDLPALTRLALDSAYLGEDHLKALGQLKKLEKLDLSGSKFPPTGLAALPALPVKNLNLAVTWVDDAAVTRVAEAYPDLEVLALDYTKLGDPGLKALGRLKKLKTLEIGNTQVTKPAVEEFKKANPMVSVRQF